MKNKILFSAIWVFFMLSSSVIADETYARKKPAFVDVGWNQLADHAYAVAKDSSGTIRTYSNAGSSSGGDKMSNTVGKGDRKYMSCVKSKRDGDCKVVWGVNGTCHQSTNLMLKKTSPLLSETTVSGYSFTKSKWGIYGDSSTSARSLGLVCVNSCGLGL